MMDWTDRHCRMFHRQLTRCARLYTEMVTAEAVIHGDRGHLIGFDPAEQPVVLQLGGSDPALLADAVGIAVTAGYEEINLNVGCPSDRVQSGRFGACLMAEPDVVARCVAAMIAAAPSRVQITVKCRIGIDNQDSETDFQDFVSRVSDAGCRTFIVHARKAWLAGLSPKQNREVPPLNYPRVYRLKASRPDLCVVINGGITTLDEALSHLDHVDGVMIGRAAYQTPYLLADVDQRIFGRAGAVVSRGDALRRYRPYVARHLEQGGRLNSVVRHILGLYHGQRGGRAFRRFLSENAVGAAASIAIYDEAIEIVEQAGLVART